jgi:hypothetical protein
MALCTIIALGLASRLDFIPALIYPYLGDTFYAMMIYAIMAIFFNKSSASNLLTLTIIICFTIEASQLYQAEWINQIRQNKLGGLILGFGFLWSDLVSYSIGSALAFLIDLNYHAQKGG